MSAVPAEDGAPPHALPEIPSDKLNLPPVTQLGMLTLALIVSSGIYLAAHIPKNVPLTPSIVLVSVAALVLAGTMIALSRIEDFAWPTFFAIAKWALLAYAIIAGMIEYAFVRNHTSGGPLVLLTISLVMFALTVPVLISFTVARYH